MEDIDLLTNIFSEFKFQNKSTFEVSVKILEELKKTDKKFTISSTGEDEILFYTKEGGDFKNLIIDEDGDVEFLIIRQEREKSEGKLFLREELNYKEISLLL